ncbi:hypothetical protein [Endozoicomonas sp. GU-1]|uniref:hypothetical protein n=1 Tax=Endozoicomonas sp. GU-1 TaxID=3009078 RepID=UPI0022B58B01|nr:hypothetical protein [Endozoicomonas sp. GU-1]WBA80078.1 hypothetical protein O2T12_17185 [Endozoicomonas sp. GU-1]WBA87653.1 hypothetical protein O3276_06415 [Endozoicomonas sp. GU-1]
MAIWGDDISGLYVVLENGKREYFETYVTQAIDSVLSNDSKQSKISSPQAN